MLYAGHTVYHGGGLLRSEDGGESWQSLLLPKGLFPGGWLHDVGLPITEPLNAVVDKGEARGRAIVIQAFQRTVLTDDLLNPVDWQVERANVGTDYLRVVGGF